MSNKNYEIICVDDDLDVLGTTEDCIKTLGHHVKSFSKVDDAISYIEENSFKIAMILSDLRMDHVNGFEFKKKLDERFLSDIPFVIFTGYWTEEMSQEAMGLGISAFLEKPVTKEVLGEQIEKYAHDRIELLNEEREMVEGFLEESSPMLDEIEGLILELEEADDKNHPLAVYFRLLHTIKGTASCVGLTQLGEYTHKYEDFIGELRTDKIPVNTESINVLLSGLDDLKQFFTEVNEQGSDKNLKWEDRVAKYDSTAIAGASASVAPTQSDDELQLNQEVPKAQAAAPAETAKSANKEEDKMTVSMNILNEFMEESGELTVIRNSILKTVKKIESKYRGDEEIELLNELLDGMYNVTSNIQVRITEMRKVPLKSTFRPFKRLVRDLSKQLGKEVEFEVDGEELLIDNIIAKLYSNTLIHILRNSLDHGLETPDVRTSVGKEATGRIDITVSEQGEDIVLKIIDDGKGIDPQIIKKKALEKNLFTSEELDKMSDKEIVNIIFASGFSTAEVVSDLSGRGVGMDMVKGSFEELGGDVYVESTKGEGSTFVLKVPIPKSVLIINTLSVRVKNDYFIFHMDEVAEVIRIEESTENTKIYEVDDKKVLCHNDEMIQLTYLSDILGLTGPDEAHEEILNIVILRIGSFKYGVIVNEIYEFEEVVARKISEGIESYQLYHGASLIGSGEVAMIVSAEGIADKIGLSFEKKKETVYETEEEFIDENVFECMLFEYAENDFLSVNLDHVTRLEKFKHGQVEFVGNNAIVRYLDKVLPIVDPAFLVGLRDHNAIEGLVEKPKDDLFEVIVLDVNDQHIGIYVHKLNEIRKTVENINSDTIDVDGLLGSIYLDGKTICVLDVVHLWNAFKQKRVETGVRENLFERAA